MVRTKSKNRLADTSVEEGARRKKVLQDAYPTGTPNNASDQNGNRKYHPSDLELATEKMARFEIDHSTESIHVSIATLLQEQIPLLLQDSSNNGAAIQRIDNALDSLFASALWNVDATRERINEVVDAYAKVAYADRIVTKYRR